MEEDRIPPPNNEDDTSCSDDAASPLTHWLSHEDDSRIARRGAEQSNLASRWRAPARKAGTSLLQSGHSCGTPCGHNSLPGFTSMGSASTGQSVATEMGARNLPSQGILENDREGTLQIAPLRGSVEFYCPFHFLRCYKKFPGAEKEQWINHSLDHFGKHGPPKKSSCCLCDWKFERAANARENWKDRMDHLALHFILRHSLSHARPDFSLHRYLYEKEIIDCSLYKELFGPVDGHYGSSSSRPTDLRSVKPARPPSDEPCIMMYSRREEERRRRVPRSRQRS